MLYIERWLTAPIVQEDGAVVEQSCGTPQGGVVSPMLANLFMHYTFDLWMARTFPELRWCRYADDGLIHCQSEVEAQTSLRSAEHSTGRVSSGIASIVNCSSSAVTPSLKN
ncbi:reverse transcriptase domain-containing protein [Bradyrhizobium sp. 5.13L]